MRAALAPPACGVLVVWVVSVAGAVGWGFDVNGGLFAGGLVLIGIRSVL
jgi:hypothetical protein